MTTPTLQIVAQTLTGHFLNTLVEGILVALVVWVLIRVIGHQNSGTRFAIWFSALASVVALPFFAARSGLHSTPLFAARREMIISGAWALYIFTAWAGIAGVSLFRLAYGLWRVRQIRKSCTELDTASIDPAIAGAIQDSTSQDTTLHRRVKLCVSNEVTVPAAIGIFRPAIVFPAQLLPQLSADEFQVILLHELAHLRRWDDWTNLAQKIVKAIFFLHPAVWWIESRLNIEREMACDDAVIAQTSSPRAYASSLISFAEKLHSARTLTLAQFLVSRMHQMSARVTQILDPKRKPGSNSWKAVVAGSVALLFLTAGAGSYAPRFVAFENPNTASQSVDFSTTAAGPAFAAPRSPTSQTSATQTSATLASATQASATQASATQASLEANLAQSARAIPASFNPRQSFRARPVGNFAGQKPVATHAHALRASLLQSDAAQGNLSQPDAGMNQRPPAPATYLILQTTQYDASGAGIWTLCIWRIEGGDSAGQQLQSAIVLSVI
jgi:Zn-dependent protease with chaperone function